MNFDGEVQVRFREGMVDQVTVRKNYARQVNRKRMDRLILKVGAFGLRTFDVEGAIHVVGLFGCRGKKIEGTIRRHR